MNSTAILINQPNTYFNQTTDKQSTMDPKAQQLLLWLKTQKIDTTTIERVVQVLCGKDIDQLVNATLSGKLVIKDLKTLIRNLNNSNLPLMEFQTTVSHAVESVKSFIESIATIANIIGDPVLHDTAKELAHQLDNHSNITNFKQTIAIANLSVDAISQLVNAISNTLTQAFDLTVEKVEHLLQENGITGSDFEVLNNSDLPPQALLFGVFSLMNNFFQETKTNLSDSSQSHPLILTSTPSSISIPDVPDYIIPPHAIPASTTLFVASGTPAYIQLKLAMLEVFGTLVAVANKQNELELKLITINTKTMLDKYEYSIHEAEKIKEKQETAATNTMISGITSLTTAGMAGIMTGTAVAKYRPKSSDVASSIEDNAEDVSYDTSNYTGDPTKIFPEGYPAGKVYDVNTGGYTAHATTTTNEVLKNKLKNDDAVHYVAMNKLTDKYGDLSKMSRSDQKQFNIHQAAIAASNKLYRKTAGADPALDDDLKTIDEATNKAHRIHTNELMTETEIRAKYKNAERDATEKDRLKCDLDALNAVYKCGVQTNDPAYSPTGYLQINKDSSLTVGKTARKGIADNSKDLILYTDGTTHNLSSILKDPIQTNDVNAIDYRHATKGVTALRKQYESNYYLANPKRSEAETQGIIKANKMRADLKTQEALPPDQRNIKFVINQTMINNLPIEIVRKQPGIEAEGDTVNQEYRIEAANQTYGEQEKAKIINSEERASKKIAKENAAKIGRLKADNEKRARNYQILTDIARALETCNATAILQAMADLEKARADFDSALVNALTSFLETVLQSVIGNLKAVTDLESDLLRKAADLLTIIQHLGGQ